MSSLNPLHKIDKQIKEIISIHKKTSSKELNQLVLNLLKEVNLEDLIMLYFFKDGLDIKRMLLKFLMMLKNSLMILDFYEKKLLMLKVIYYL